MDYSLVYYGSEILKGQSEPVKIFDDRIMQIVESMFTIMKKANGIGLAAPQVGLGERIIVIDISGKQNVRTAIINPEITASSESLGDYEEGCLSIPGIYADVIRPLEVTVKGFDPKGKEIKFNADALLARVLQHEIDHLNGVLFIDRIEDHIKKEFTRELKSIKKLNKL
jgi:peptide deformylase